MEIIIPANRIDGDINSQVVVDNEITKVIINNYKVEKVAANEDNAIQGETQNANSVFSDSNYSYGDYFIYFEGKRVEAFYTTGSMTVTTNLKIDNITNFQFKLNGSKTKTNFFITLFGFYEIIKKKYWTPKGIATDLIGFAESNHSPEVVENEVIKHPEVYGCTVPNRQNIEIKNITLSRDGTYTIDIDFKVLTAYNTYHLKSTGAIPYFNDIVFFEGTSFSLTLFADTVDVKQDKDISKTFGDGNTQLEYKTNELFQLENTYNDGVLSIPLGEYVSNQVISIYSNGRKTSSFSTLTDNLIVSNDKLENGSYGIRGRLERQIYNIGDNVIPYKVDTSLKSMPNSEYLGVPQSFRVSENEIQYDGKLKQSLTAQENTYYNIYYDEGSLSVTRKGTIVGNTERIYREEKLDVVPTLPYNNDYVATLEVNGQSMPLIQDSINLEKYVPIEIKVIGFTNISLLAKKFVVISGGSVEETIYMPQFSSSFGMPIGLKPNLVGFVEDALHRISITTRVEDINGNIYEETQTVLSGKYGDTFNTTNIGKNKSVVLKMYLSRTSVSINVTNSSSEKLVYIKINSVEQIEG